MGKESDHIEDLRKRIDEIDYQIILLLKERLDIAGAIGKQKRKQRIKIINDDREKELLHRLVTLCTKIGLDANFISTIWKEILHQSYQIQAGVDSEK